MANGIRTGNPHGFNKGRSLKFHECSRVRQTPEEGRRIYRPKRCGNNNKDEDDSLKTLNYKTVKRHLNLKYEISIHFLYGKFKNFIFDINIRPPIKTKEEKT